VPDYTERTEVVNLPGNEDKWIVLERKVGTDCLYQRWPMIFESFEEAAGFATDAMRTRAEHCRAVMCVVCSDGYVTTRPPSGCGREICDTCFERLEHFVPYHNPILGGRRNPQDFVIQACRRCEVNAHPWRDVKPDPLHPKIFEMAEKFEEAELLRMSQIPRYGLILWVEGERDQERGAKVLWDFRRQSTLGGHPTHYMLEGHVGILEVPKDETIQGDTGEDSLSGGGVKCPLLNTKTWGIPQ